MKFYSFHISARATLFKYSFLFLERFIPFECCDDPLNGTTSDVALKMGMQNFSDNVHVIKMCTSDIQSTLVNSKSRGPSKSLRVISTLN